MIEGVIITKNKSFKSEGDKGDLCPEIFKGRGVNEFQVNLNTVGPGLVKGKHMHLKKEESFFCVKGRLWLYLEDAREGSPTQGKREKVSFNEDDRVTVLIPPGVWHSVENTGDATGYFLEYSNRFFDTSDEFKRPFTESDKL